jgi:quercetin dioxygenase-like cupin family protein
MTTAAQAGSCPADKVMTDAQKPGATAPVGVEDKVIGSIPLAGEAPRLADHKLRLRRLVIKPGGVVPWHSHGERPAIIYIVSGTIVEYRSTCAVPIVHRAGEATEEIHTTSHWWKNTTSRPVVLLSADILHEKGDPHTM